MLPLHKFRSLTTEDRWALIQAAVLLAATQLLLATPRLSLPQVHRLLVRVAQSLPTRGATPPPERIRWAVDVSTDSLPGEITCLPRALVTESLLRNWRYDSALQIGVTQRQPGEIAAHAWVEHENRVLIGDLPDLHQFSPLPLDNFDVS